MIAIIAANVNSVWNGGLYNNDNNNIWKHNIYVFLGKTCDCNGLLIRCWHVKISRNIRSKDFESEWMSGWMGWMDEVQSRRCFDTTNWHFRIRVERFFFENFMAAKLAIHLQFISVHNYREGAELAKFGFSQQT